MSWVTAARRGAQPSSSGRSEGSRVRARSFESRTNSMKSVGVARAASWRVVTFAPRSRNHSRTSVSTPGSYEIPAVVVIHSSRIRLRPLNSDGPTLRGCLAALNPAAAVRYQTELSVCYFSIARLPTAGRANVLEPNGRCTAACSSPAGMGREPDRCRNRPIPAPAQPVRRRARVVDPPGFGRARIFGNSAMCPEVIRGRNCRRARESFRGHHTGVDRRRVGAGPP